MAATVFLGDYFDYWSGETVVGFDQSRYTLNPAPIRPYYSDAFHQWSLELLVPNNRDLMFYPGQSHSSASSATALPQTLKSALHCLGFTAARHEGELEYRGGRWILRDHHFPIDIGIYRTQILPNFCTTELGPLRRPNGLPYRIPQCERFAYALRKALADWIDDIDDSADDGSFLATHRELHHDFHNPY